MATTSTPISEQERAKRDRAFVATIANLRIEDFHLDDESKRIFQRHVDGEISDEEFLVADLTVHVSLENALRFVIQMEILDSKVGDGCDECTIPLRPFLFTDWSRGCCHW